MCATGTGIGAARALILWPELVTLGERCSRSLSWLWPLIIDGTIIPATLGIVALAPEDGFTDEAEHGTPDKDAPDAPGDEAGNPPAHEGPRANTTTPPGDPTAAPAGQATPEQAAPATAPAPASGDAARNVSMPDGQVVSAPDARAAQVMRSVMSGTSVTDAFKQVGVDLAPPGTPVTDPVDPNTMPPTSVGRFESREPVMAGWGR